VNIIIIITIIIIIIIIIITIITIIIIIIIRFKDELAHGANAGLDTATMWLEPVYRKVLYMYIHVCIYMC
jgi:hypothetical protein